MLYLFIGLLAVAVFICLILWLCSWSESKHGAKIKFKSFKMFYNLNPERWILRHYYVVCITKIAYGMNFGEDYFYFGPIDFLRYGMWMCENERHKKQANKAEMTARMLAAVKQDIENTENKAKKYQNKAINDLQNILENLK